MKDAMLIVHFIGLAMGLGTSIGMMVLGMASAKMEKEEGKKFMLNATALVKMGQTGLVLLLVSGLYLIQPFLADLGENYLLITKLVLFVVLSGLIGMISAKARKAKAGDAGTHMAKVKPIGMLALFIALTIVVLAVLIFEHPGMFKI